MAVLLAVSIEEMANSTKWESPPGSRHVTAVLVYRSSLVSPNTGDGSSTTNTNKKNEYFNKKYSTFLPFSVNRLLAPTKLPAYLFYSDA